jgi:hypothetical protein
MISPEDKKLIAAFVQNTPMYEAVRRSLLAGMIGEDFVAMPPLGIPRHVLRVECIRCARIVEIQKADAVRFYGPHAVWKDVGQRLLDQTCSNRTGRLEEDGCWPDWTR